jgi:hypothetical protein
MDQQGSSSTDEQHTYILSKDQPCVQSVMLDGVYSQAAKGYVRSAKLQLDRRPTHSHFVEGSAMCADSKSGDRWRINTLTLSTGRKCVQSAKLELDHPLAAVVQKSWPIRKTSLVSCVWVSFLSTPILISSSIACIVRV